MAGKEVSGTRQTSPEDLVRLAADLQVDQVNFKQCDVVRGGEERNLGLFASKADREIRRYEKALAKARKLARKLGIETTAFAFVPDELPVCDQDPRNSLFVRYDGSVSPCINLAVGDRDPKRVAALSDALTGALIDYSDTARPEAGGRG